MGDKNCNIRHCLIKMADKKQSMVDFIRFHPQWATLLKSVQGNREDWLHAIPKDLALDAFYSQLKPVAAPQPDGYEDIEGDLLKHLK